MSLGLICQSATSRDNLKILRGAGVAVERFEALLSVQWRHDHGWPWPAHRIVHWRQAWNHRPTGGWQEPHRVFNRKVSSSCKELTFTCWLVFRFCLVK
jgi:hypothetical protein